MLNILIAFASTLLWTFLPFMGNVQAIEPPRPVSEYFAQADVAAEGTVSNLKIRGIKTRNYQISYTFHVSKFWKGKDRKRFKVSYEVFDPHADEKSLREYYSREKYVLFYKLIKNKGKISRDSLWIAPLTDSLLQELAALSK